MAESLRGPSAVQAPVVPRQGREGDTAEQTRWRGLPGDEETPPTSRPGFDKVSRLRHLFSVPPSDRVRRIIDLADQLPVDERRELEIALLDHDVSDAEAQPLPEWLRDELERRLAEDASVGQPWRGALAELRDELRRS